MPGNSHSITIYHTNDMHGELDLPRKMASLEREPESLLLDAGDALAGSNTMFKLSEPIIDQMNRAGYDAMAMGNREFNYARWVLKRRWRQADFPILCANLKDLHGAADEFFTPYIIKETAGLRVCIIGLTPVQYDDGSLWLPLLRFSFKDPKKTLDRIIEEVKPKSDLVILLSHLGLDVDRKIADATPDAHLIIGGHSHTLLEKPIKVNGRYIFQAGSHGTGYGIIRAEVDPVADNPITSLEYKFIRSRER